MDAELMSKVTQGRDTKNFFVADGVNVTGMILSCKSKGIAAFSNNTKKTIAYAIAVGEIKNSPPSLVKVLPEPHPGVRFIHSNRFKKGANADHYRGILQRWAAERKEPAPNVDRLLELAREQIQGADMWTLDLSHPAFDSWSKLSIHVGDRIFIHVDVSLNEPILPPGTKVQVDGLRPNIYIHVPKTKAAAAVVKTGGEANPAGGASTAADENDEPKDGGGKDDDKENATLAPHLINPVDKSFFVFSLRAGIVAAIDPEFNALPLDKRIATFVNPETQRFSLLDPNSQSLLFCPLNETGTPFTPGKERGLLVGPSKPEGYGKEAGRTGADDPRTYLGNKGPVMPVKVVVTIYRVVTVDALTPELRGAYQDVVDSSKDPNKKVLKSDFGVNSTIWAGSVRESGIADGETWADVNAFARIPAQIVLAQSFKKVGKLDVVMTAWEIKSYVQGKGFRLPTAYAHAILGNGKQSIGLTDFGKDAKFAGSMEIVDVVNTGNLIRGSVDLFNASESKADLAPYLDPKNGWQPWALIVPNTKTFASEAMDDDDRKAIMDLLATIPMLKTPEEGKALIEAIGKECQIKPAAMDRFGIYKAKVRVLVWFLKPDAPVPDKMDVVVAQPAPPVLSPIKHKRKTPEEPAVLDSADLMSVDDDENKKPAADGGSRKKKARKE